MMGTKTLSETRAAIREAFRRAGLDPETWFDQEIHKAQQQPAASTSLVKTLQLLRDALAREVKKGPGKRKRKQRSPV